VIFAVEAHPVTPSFNKNCHDLHAEHRPNR
jgi:hypothetical protein